MPEQSGRRVVVTGASGMIGSALSTALLGRGDTVVHLVRRAPRTAAEVQWSPGSELDPAVLAGSYAVVNLAGAGIADRRWSARYRAEIRRSRIDSTRTLCRALTRVEDPIRLVSGSAVGYYGNDNGDDVLTEERSAGTGFLAEVCTAWEGQTAMAASCGHPVARVRSGLVFAPHGGAMAKLLPLAELGLAGPLGQGRQFWPWITLPDEVAALVWLIDHPEVTGPVNLTAPTPARQADLMRILGRELGRPSRVPAPALALRAALGAFADDLLGSQRVVPAVLTEHGFRFRHAEPDAAVAWLIEEYRRDRAR